MHSSAPLAPFRVAGILCRGGRRRRPRARCLVTGPRQLLVASAPVPVRAPGPGRLVVGVTLPDHSALSPHLIVRGLPGGASLGKLSSVCGWPHDLQALSHATPGKHRNPRAMMTA
ncbi:hypothetical protein CURTO8I2_250091 [Curtobacterium sp. 8I-2]|nr:hypothetical protein CURTO8I2_250091 [Curtobacterium sp. 8I-2]